MNGSMAARPAVDLVVGFGGVVIRENVAASADVFIQCDTLAPVLPLALSEDERGRLQGTVHREVLAKGVALIETGKVVFRSHP